MKIIEHKAIIVDPLDIKQMFHKLEIIGKVSYRKAASYDFDEMQAFVKRRIHPDNPQNKHLSLLRHIHITAHFTTDRSISHQLVRHAFTAINQESTRYTRYNDGSDIKTNNSHELEFVCPAWFDYDQLTSIINKKNNNTFNPEFENYHTQEMYDWLCDMENAEKSYMRNLTKYKQKPEQAMGILPHHLATRLYFTTNLQEWIHIFNVRVCDFTGMAHPNMKLLLSPLLKEFKRLIPIIFDDITV
jgi:thymidylate synthase (FAD)